MAGFGVEGFLFGVVGEVLLGGVEEVLFVFRDLGEFLEHEGEVLALVLGVLAVLFDTGLAVGFETLRAHSRRGV